MVPGVMAGWLPSALLLMQVPGCVPLHGPSSVTGTVGESLSVACHYEEKYKAHNKFWCRVSLLRCIGIVKTGASNEERKGRVSIRDHPATLTFTVTLENLTLEDAGSYMCSVDIPFTNGSWWEITPSFGIDSSFKVVVSVVPASTPHTPAMTTSLATSLTTSLAISLATKSPTGGSTMKEHHEHPEPQGLSLPVLLSVLVLLLFLLVGTSLLAWRMFQKRQVKADNCPELYQNLRQARELHQEGAGQRESQYVNLQLHTWPLREEPAPPSQVELEYSLVALPKEELHYASVAFDSQKQVSHDNGNSSCLPRDQEAEYSQVRKPRKDLSDPCL